MVLFVSSTEPASFTRHLPPHRSSTMPERYGCDVLWNVGTRWWGVQRKKISDFIASVLDGRLAKEVGQMQQTPFPYVVIEGELKWAGDVLVWSDWGQEVSRNQWNGMLWSLQLQGVAVGYARDARGTADTVKGLMGWSAKGKHSSMARRPGPVGRWGKADSREFGEHLLMGLPGVGPELARKMWERWGRVPWRWDVTVEELMEVEGVGKAKAKQMLEALG